MYRGFSIISAEIMSMMNGRQQWASINSNIVKVNRLLKLIKYAYKYATTYHSEFCVLMVQINNYNCHFFVCLQLVEYGSALCKLIILIAISFV